MAEIIPQVSVIVKHGALLKSVWEEGGM